MQTAEVVLSVVVPCYNDGRFLHEAVFSAQAVPGNQHEIIVVNDGSTDMPTLAVLQEIEASGVQVIHQANRGLGAARNRAIASARGRYVLPLDADNRLLHDYIPLGIEVLDREPAIDVVYGDAEYFGDRTGRWHVPDFSLRQLLDNNYIDACAVFRRSAWERCGGYDEHMPVPGREDWDLWVRIAMSGGRFHHIAKPLFEYRTRRDSMTSTMINPGQYEVTRHYVHAKRVEMTIGEYAQPQHSLDFILDRLRRRPVHTLLALITRAFLPSLLPPQPLPSQPNDRQIHPRPLRDATS